MDLYRFYVPDLTAQANPANSFDDNLLPVIRLPDDQARHARSVLRLEAGQNVLLFDGHGYWCEATLAHTGKQATTATVKPPLQHDAEPSLRLTLAPAVPKGERAEWLVDVASQLYVSKIQWLACDRGVVKPREGGGKIEKWRRLAIESAKQCGRTYLMKIEEPLTLDALLQAASSSTVIVWLDPRARHTYRTFIPEVLAARTTTSPLDIIALVGPEGGWSPREEALVRGYSPPVHALRLTRTVLRVETAALALAAVLLSSE
jgi:16S rRNA (uracil1498-N3)-methyltransferase